MKKYIGGISNRSVGNIVCHSQICSKHNQLAHQSTLNRINNNNNNNNKNINNVNNKKYTAASRKEITPEEQCHILQKELQETKHALRMTRLRLMQLEKNASLGNCETLLKQFALLDRSAFQAASELRYTGFALQNSHDHLLMELRRILAIGLDYTSGREDSMNGEIDRAAIEAGALNYIRANVGFRADHVRDSPAVLLKLDNTPSSKDKTQ